MPLVGIRVVDCVHDICQGVYCIEFIANYTVLKMGRKLEIYLLVTNDERECEYAKLVPRLLCHIFVFDYLGRVFQQIHANTSVDRTCPMSVELNEPAFSGYVARCLHEARIMGVARAFALGAAVCPKPAISA